MLGTPGNSYPTLAVLPGNLCPPSDLSLSLSLVPSSNSFNFQLPASLCPSFFLSLYAYCMRILSLCTALSSSFSLSNITERMSHENLSRTNRPRRIPFLFRPLSFSSLHFLCPVHLFFPRVYLSSPFFVYLNRVRICRISGSLVLQSTFCLSAPGQTTYLHSRVDSLLFGTLFAG